MCCRRRGNGAQEKTRTSTGLPPQVPETCASTKFRHLGSGQRKFVQAARFVNVHFGKTALFITGAALWSGRKGVRFGWRATTRRV